MLKKVIAIIVGNCRKFAGNSRRSVVMNKCLLVRRRTISNKNKTYWGKKKKVFSIPFKKNMPLLVNKEEAWHDKNAVVEKIVQGNT